MVKWLKQEVIDMLARIRRSNSRGDTIVEVLIATAIVSSVLVGAFAVTQKSAQAVRDSQERSEVLHLLQGQVELVRAAAAAATGYTDSPFNGSSYFCMVDSSTARQNFTNNGTPSSDYSNYNTACKDLGAGHLYNIADFYDNASHTFTFEAHWDSISGSTDNESIYYKIYPSN